MQREIWESKWKGCTEVKVNKLIFNLASLFILTSTEVELLTEKFIQSRLISY